MITRLKHTSVHITYQNITLKKSLHFNMPIEIDDARVLVDTFPNSILTCNVQSINKNFDRVKELIIELGYPTIVNLNEIWQPKLNINIHKYQTPLTHIRSTTGGGIAIYISNLLNYSPFDPINEMQTNHLEKLAAEITTTYRSTHGIWKSL